MKHLFLALSAAVVVFLSSQSVSAAEWSDFSLGYYYGTQFREPGIDSFIQKNVISINSVNGYKHGSNFINLDILFSNGKDPANGSDNGATELYFVYNHQFGYGKIFNGKPLDYGILKDVSMLAGTDLSAKNTAFAPAKKSLYMGPTLNLAIPTSNPGFLDLSLMAYKEWNHNGITHKNVSFDPTYMLSAAWGVPFKVASVPLNFKGYACLVGEKGKDGFNEETKPEIFMHSYLMADVVALMGKPNLAWLGIGLEYWNNKFGNANTRGTNEPTICPMVRFELHPF